MSDSETHPTIPLVAGGQGRTDDDIRGEMALAAFSFLAFLAFVFGVAAWLVLR